MVHKVPSLQRCPQCQLLMEVDAGLSSPLHSVELQGCGSVLAHAVVGSSVT